MVKNNVTNTEDIQVKVDQNNLIYIEPNSTVDADGNVNPRNIQAEKLIMYVNLEADIVPRSILVSDNETNTLTSIASGTLNFLKNGDGQDYDTTWTDSFLNTEEKKDNKGNPTGELASAIDAAFGSYENFKDEFAKAATTRFGSGWAWLCVSNGKLEICSTANQDNPLMGEGCEGSPILALDVWEHAYYLNYQNRRPDYINAFFNVIDWNVVSGKFIAAK